MIFSLIIDLLIIISSLEDAKSAATRIADLEETLKNAKETAAKERKQFEQSVLLQKVP